MAAARVQVTVDLPTPPLPLTTAMTFLISDRGFMGARKSMGAVRSPQDSPQEEQSWVHSDMAKSPFLIEIREIQGKWEAAVGRLSAVNSGSCRRR